MTTNHPLEASLSGKNAYYLGLCRHTEHNPAYAACLDKIRRIDAGEKLGPDLTRCAVAIGQQTCQAKNMRQAEELAGEALYFVPRESIAKEHNAVPPWSVMPKTMTATKPQRDPPRVLRSTTDGIHPNIGGSYADAINNAMKEQPQERPVPELTDAQQALYTGIAKSEAFTAEAAHKAFAPVARPPSIPGETPTQYAARLRALRNPTNQEPKE